MTRQRQPMNNRLLWLIEIIQEKINKTTSLDPKNLYTENRKDIEYRVEFLQNIMEKKTPYEKTKYYHFISDTDKGITRNPNIASKEFLQLCENIKQNGILEPIIVGKYNNPVLKTRHIIKGTKFWSEIQNKTGYQLIDGAHRLAIALFLQHKKIPVKVIRPFTFEIPNYTSYLETKEKEYL
jgi:hypothetical protein